MQIEADYRIDNKLAVITKKGSAFGLKYLSLLNGRNIKPQLVIVEKVTFKKRYKLARYLIKKIGIFDAIRYNSRFLSQAVKDMFRQYDYSSYGQIIIHTDDINNIRMAEIIKENNIETIALAHAGILKSKNLLNGDFWIINSHPAILPKMRGVDVIKWSLFMREKLGITLHLVKRKIDAGDILARFDVQLEESDTLESIEHRIIDKSIEVLVDATISGPDHYKVFTEQIFEEGMQFYLMPFSIRKQLECNFEKTKLYYLREHKK